jgi:perosamine synthetase
MQIPIFNTFINKEAFDNVKEVLESTFLSEGKLVKQFEDRLAGELGLLYPVALNSGTSALHLALELAGIGSGDEVILPAQTFVASGLVIKQQHATPVFADIDYETGNISVESIKSKITSKTKAIMPVHWGGYPCDMEEIRAIAVKHNLVIIEDAAHALGAVYKGKPIGALSDYTCFSFQAIKHLTTGDGGAISFLKQSKATEAYTKRWFGIDRENAGLSILGERQYNIPELGFKYHMNNYAAALGLANLNGFMERMAKRLKLADQYNQALSKVPGVSLFEYKTDRQSAYWLYGMHVENREKFILALKSKGIVASVIHQRIDRNRIFGGIKEDLINQRRFDETQIHIPLHDAMDEEKVNYIINAIKEGW